MKTVKWETMKKKAMEEFWNGTSEYSNNNVCFLALFGAMGGKEKPRAILKEWQDYGTHLIEKWDIRLCMKLAELFPSCLPKGISVNSKAKVEMDEKANWVLIFE